MLVTSPAVEAVSAAVAGLFGDDLSEQPDVAVMGDVEQLLTARARIDARIAASLAVVDARDTTVVECGRGTRSWLIEEQLLDGGPAARKVRLARSRWRWPATVAAWEAGEVSEEHVAVIFTALRTVPAEFAELVEKTLLELSRELCPRGVAEAVDAILVACGADESADAAAARRYTRRGVTVAKTFGGTGSLAGTLSPVLADKLIRVLELVGRPAGAEDERTRAQRAHDALESVVDHYLDTSDLPEADRGERPARVIVTVPLEVLERRLREAWGLLPSAGMVGPETARRMACDAEVIPFVLGGRGEVLDQGQSSRSHSPRVRRAAVVRDGDRCVFPQCQNPRHECHHLVHWADGGPSTLANAAWLCAFHHWLVHEGSWNVHREPDGGYTFTGPTGRWRSSSAQPRPRLPWNGTGADDP